MDLISLNNQDNLNIPENNSKIYILKEWSIVATHQYEDNRYKAPECLLISLQGNIYNHPYFKDNSFVSTNYIVNVNDCYVKTQSGSIYKLVGEPSQSYKEYCKERNISIDLNNPIKIIKI